MPLVRMPLSILSIPPGWFLNESNTGLAGMGIDRNTLPVYTGGKPSANSKISLKKITIQLDLSNGNIEIDRCWISPLPGVGTGISLLTNWMGAPCNIHDSDFDCNDMTDTNEHKAVVSNSFAFLGNGNVLRCHMTNMAQGIRIVGLAGTSLVVENNLIYNMWTAASSHCDAITIRKFIGHSLWIHNNFADNSGIAASPAMFMQCSDGVINNVIIEGNYFNSSNWALGLEDGMARFGRTYGDNMQLINNRFGSSGFGPIAIDGGPGFSVKYDNYKDNSAAPDHKGALIDKVNPNIKISRLNPTTYTTIPLGDVKPELMIGGNDPAKFVPNINMSFGFGGDEEFFINFNNKNKVVNSEISNLVNDKISQTVNGEIDEFYIDAEGRLKFDTVYTQRPSSMVIEYDLDYSDGIEFCIQDTLENEWEQSDKKQTLEQYLSTHQRPDEVVGSYYIYCNKKNNKYKTGQIAFVHRMLLIDAEGKTAWCSAWSMPTAKKMQAIMPSDFWDTAVLPVRRDPTIGYTTAGGSIITDQLSIIKLGTTMPEDGTLNLLYVYSAHDGTAQVIKIGLYNDSAGSPGTLFAGPTDLNISSGVAQWWSVGAAGSLSNGVSYYPATRMGTHTKQYYNAGSAGDSWYGTGTMVNSPVVSTGNFRFSIYVDYTAGGNLALTGISETLIAALSDIDLYLGLSATAETITSISAIINLYLQLTAACESITAAMSDVNLLLNLSGESTSITATNSEIDLYLALSAVSESITSANSAIDLYIRMTGLSESTTSANSDIDLYLQLTALSETLTAALAEITISGTINLSGVVEPMTSALAILTLTITEIASRITGEIRQQCLKGSIGEQAITGEIGDQYIKGKIN